MTKGERQKNIAREIKRLGGDPIAQPLVKHALEELRHSQHPLALACGLIHLESGFLNIFGHDAVRNPVKSPHNGILRVTEVNVRDYLRHRNRGQGSQGVGYAQLTYHTYQDRAMRLGGLWLVEPQLHVAFEDLDAMIHAYGERDGLGAYNAGPQNRFSFKARRYADLVLGHVAEWLPVINHRPDTRPH